MARASWRVPHGGINGAGCCGNCLAAAANERSASRRDAGEPQNVGEPSLLANVAEFAVSITTASQPSPTKRRRAGNDVAVVVLTLQRAEGLKTLALCG